ncbi:MAG: hypothetical protein ABEI97_00010 [Candidatus Nanohaloarchaea archaeon]
MTVRHDILPDWLDSIVEAEYGEDVEDARRRSVGERFWQVGNQFTDFDTFYREAVSTHPEKRLSGEHRAHALDNYWTGAPWNCLGKTVFASGVGEVGLGDDIGIVLQSTGREHPQSGAYWQNSSHVKVEGPDGTEYGPDAPYAEKVDGRGTVVEDGRIYSITRHDQDILPALYRLSDAQHAWENGNPADAAALVEEAAADAPRDAEYVSRKLEEIDRFGF